MFKVKSIKLPATINFKVTEDLKEELQDASEKLGIGCSSIIRLAIVEFLNKKNVGGNARHLNGDS